MWNVLAQARERGAAALERVAEVTAAVGGGDHDGGLNCPGGFVCGATNTQLNTALRKVTHVDAAVVDRSAVREVVKLAGETEDNIAVVLRHLEVNVGEAPPQWRRIHGALQLLLGLLRSSGGSDEELPLVGRVWFEVKMLGRLDALAEFSYEDDSRVAVLIKRAAAAVREEAERTILKEEEEEGEVTSPSAARAHNLACARSREEASGDEARGMEKQSGGFEASSSSNGSPEPRTIGRAEAEGQENGAAREGGGQVRSNGAAPEMMASKLAALSQPGTRAQPQQPPPIAAAAAAPAASLSRRFCRCLWRPYMRVPPSEAEEELPAIRRASQRRPTDSSSEIVNLIR